MFLREPFFTFNVATILWWKSCMLEIIAVRSKTLRQAMSLVVTHVSTDHCVGLNCNSANFLKSVTILYGVIEQNYHVLGTTAYPIQCNPIYYNQKDKSFTNTAITVLHSMIHWNKNKTVQIVRKTNKMPILMSVHCSEFMNLAMWYLQLLSAIGRWCKCGVVFHFTSWFIDTVLSSRRG